MLRKLSVLSRSPHKALTARLSDSNADRKKGRKYFINFDDDMFLDDEDETLSEEPPAAALQKRRRRRALVPPKLITDGYESASELDPQGSTSPRTLESSKILMDPLYQSKSQTDLISASLNIKKDLIFAGSCSILPKSAQQDESNKANEGENVSIHSRMSVMPNVTIDSCDDKKDGNETNLVLTPTGEGPSGLQKPRHKISTTSSSASSNSLGANLNANNLSKQRRRSSVVVIPPMQICPGDLLVYSKVLSQRSNMMGKHDLTNLNDSKLIFPLKKELCPRPC